MFLIITFLSVCSGEIKRQDWQKKSVEEGLKFAKSQNVLFVMQDCLCTKRSNNKASTDTQIFKGKSAECAQHMKNGGLWG